MAAGPAGGYEAAPALRRTAVATAEPPAAKAEGDCAPSCCPRYHQAVELVGKRWTGAILAVMLQGGTMRFSEIAQAVPALSDRLLSERMKELERCGIVEREVTAMSPIKVEYALTDRGRQLEPALNEIKDWADRWLE
jgi:DNA-binding HxlR family transcriptional regulator